MSTIDLVHLRGPQIERLARFGAAASVDVHCHCLPGLDDGPPTPADALALCRALADDGITGVIATPHQLGPFESVLAAHVRAAVELLRAELAHHAVPLTVRAGAEVRVDERLIERLDAGGLLTLGDHGKHLMIELPHSTLLDVRPLIERLAERGITPVLSHPERHGALARAPHLVLPWLEHGMLLQITGASLLGEFGPSALRAGWQMLENGWVSLVASDAHDTAQRGPGMARAIDAIAGRLGHAVARRLCVVHPALVFDGKPVPRPIVRRAAGGRR